MWRKWLYILSLVHWYLSWDTRRHSSPGLPMSRGTSSPASLITRWPPLALSLWCCPYSPSPLTLGSGFTCGSTHPDSSIWIAAQFLKVQMSHNPFSQVPSELGQFWIPEYLCSTYSRVLLTRYCKLIWVDRWWFMQILPLSTVLSLLSFNRENPGIIVSIDDWYECICV